MYDVKLAQLPTGRTHLVNGNLEAILDAAGEPESEYVLGALIDDSFVPLERYTVGYVEHMVARPDTTLETGASSSSTGADTPADAAQPAAGAAPPAG